MAGPSRGTATSKRVSCQQTSPLLSVLVRDEKKYIPLPRSSDLCRRRCCCRCFSRAFMMAHALPLRGDMVVVDVDID